MNSYQYTNGLLQRAEEATKKQRDCPDCGQKVLEKCISCDQFIKKTKLEEDDLCDTCGQELPEEEEEEEEFEEQKDGTLRKICGCCRRKCTICPECEQDYESDQDFTDEEGSSDEEGSNERSVDEEGSKEPSVDETQSGGDSRSESKTVSESSYEPATKHRRTRSY